MTIMNLTFISLFLTIALIVALISFAFVVNLNKKLTRAKNNEGKFNTDNIIEAISSELCISSSQLNRKVKLMTGMTTSHLILETRLKKAKKQLTLTQKPIGEIAMECGFNDFAYFSRSFKKEFDMTPSAFQRIPHSVNLTREQA